MNSRIGLSIGFIALGAISAANADLVGRYSANSYNYIMGYAGDNHSGSGTPNTSALLPASSFPTLINESANGTYLPTNHVWSANVVADIKQSYSIDTNTLSFGTLTGSMSTRTTSTQSGATSDIGASSEMSLRFTSTSSQLFKLSGAIDTLGPINRNNATLYLYEVVGTSLVTMDLFFLQGSFAKDYTLGPGTYQLSGYLNAAATGNEDTYAKLNYQIAAVPEPSSLAVLGLGTAAIMRRRKRAISR